MTDPGRYQLGSRVYRGGSYAPTQGTVDPTGYVERELRKRNTMTYPSDTRSGLAAAALQRVRGMGTMSPAMPQPPASPNTPSWPGAGHYGGTMGEAAGSPPPAGGENDHSVYFQALQHTLQSRLAAAHAEHATGVAQLQDQIQGRPTVSPTGKISPFSPSGEGINLPNHAQFQATAPVGGGQSEGTAGIGASAPPVSAVPSHPSATPAVTHPGTAPATPAIPAANTALPFELQGSMEAMNASSQFGQLLNQLLMGRQEAQRNYATGMHELDMQQPNDERGLLNQFAGRGLAHSSGYGVGYGNLENQYAGERSGLADTLAQLMTNYGLQQAQGQGDYNQQLAAIKLAIASRLSGQAGNLGLGT